MALDSPLRTLDSTRLWARAQGEGGGTFYVRCRHCDHIYRAWLTRSSGTEQGREGPYRRQERGPRHGPTAQHAFTQHVHSVLTPPQGRDAQFGDPAETQRGPVIHHTKHR